MMVYFRCLNDIHTTLFTIKARKSLKTPGCYVSMSGDIGLELERQIFFMTPA